MGEEWNQFPQTTLKMVDNNVIKVKYMKIMPERTIKGLQYKGCKEKLIIGILISEIPYLS